MTEAQIKILVKETIDIGADLIFKKISSKGYELYCENINQILEKGYQIYRDKVKLQTCHIISKFQVNDFRLSILEQIFFVDGKGTYGKVTRRNSEEQIKKRFILNINRYLPCLL